MPPTHSSRVRTLSAWLGIVVLVELTLLRTGTRTLIHIPGLGRYEVSLGLLSELGRLAYYLAVVLVIATLAYCAWLYWTAVTTRLRVGAVMIWSFLAVSFLGRIGVTPDHAVAWISVLVMIGLLASTWTGIRTLPLGLFIAASGAASWSVLGQGSGGGLSAQSVDLTVVVAEGLLILAAVSTPLLLTGKVRRTSLIAGLVSVGLFTAGFSLGGSTLSILTMWNLGVPGWFAPFAYGLALGGLVVTMWSAVANREVLVACVVLLIVAGGVGPISTYQTGLAIAAVALAGWAPRVPVTESGRLSRDEPKTEEEPALMS
jgi:hypothetical protein